MGARRWLSAGVALAAVAAGTTIIVSGAGGASAGGPQVATAAGAHRAVVAEAARAGYRVHAADPRTRVAPRHYHAFSVDTDSLRRQLAATPTSGAAARGAEPTQLVVPAPNGASRVFEVVEDSVMEAGLQARHPEIRTYAGREVGDPTVTGRFDLTPMGFHAFVRDTRGHGSWMVDPATNARGETTHLSYYRSSVPAVANPGLDAGELPGADAREAKAMARTATPVRTPRVDGALVTQHVYRLALVNDPAYATYFGSANVLAEKATLMNRVDELYNDDLAIKMVLVDGTPKLNLDTKAKFSGAGGPCGASACFRPSKEPVSDGCTGNLLDRNDFVVGQIIGADSYDIGHIGLGVDGGGLAGLGVVGTSARAEGCTGLSKPDGDFYAVDYVAHEMGHQFGANHTFQGNNGACGGGNRHAGTSVEPGSGSTVMAYAGICGSDNLQPHSDPYFSEASIKEITARYAATPANGSERQSVVLRGFDRRGEKIRIAYGSKKPVTLTLGSSYTAGRVASVVASLTGKRPKVSGYDTTSFGQDKGFTLDWASSAKGRDFSRVKVTSPSKGVSAQVGVLRNGGPVTNQGTKIVTDDHAPIVTVPADVTLPIRTPFTLTGSGEDADGDALVYLWEQTDRGGNNGIGLASNTKPVGPLFRVFGQEAIVGDSDALIYNSPGENAATADPSRTFPDLAQILAGNTNAATGTCPAFTGGANTSMSGAQLQCFSEFLPTSDYATGAGALHFRLTARDLNPNGGGIGVGDVTLTVGSAGPLLVTSRSTAGTTASGGASETVTWAVNGTDAGAYAPQVQIAVSTDGGATWTDAGGPTANDGSATITLPNVSTTDARIRVAAVGNYFFAINGADFTITAN